MGFFVSSQYSLKINLANEIESRSCVCDACKTEGVFIIAEGFCAACKETMCADCLKVHRKQKMSKDHTILSVEELSCNPETVMKLAEGFTCSEHDGEDIKYYCQDHKVPCCGTCFFHAHKICAKVLDLNEELPALLSESSKPDEIIADMMQIETNLHNFMELNESSVNILETKVNKLTDQIREVRKKINVVLDELEIRVKTEGNILYKEDALRKQEENHQSLTLFHAVRNSRYQLEAVEKYGNNLQKFLLAEKMRLQLYSYCNLVGEKYDTIDTVIPEVEFAPAIQSILSLSLSEVGKIVTTTRSNTLSPICLRKRTKDCRVERVGVFDLKNLTDNEPYYSGVTFLPGDRVMLVDYCNLQCILLSSSYQFIASHALKGNPWNICVLDGQKVAVSLYYQNEIQILSLMGDVITPVRIITTKYSCDGIAAAGNGDIVVSSDCGNDKKNWSLISTEGNVKYSHQYDSASKYYNYVALNTVKTRVYVTGYEKNSLFSFEMDGRKQFTYSSDNLRGPQGVGVDRDDNIYILGFESHNIHQLSPDGSVLHVITSGVPKSPYAICIQESKDMLIITNGSDRTKLYIHQLK